MTGSHCTSCGHRRSPGARFCTGCGLPHLTDDVVGSPDVLRLLSPVERGRGAAWPLLAVMTLAVGLLGWRVLQPGSDTSRPSVAEPGGVIGESGEPTAGDLLSEDPTSPDHATRIPRPPNEAVLAELAVEDITERDEFAALAGHHVFVSHAGGLLRFDTDTGDVDRYHRSQIAGSLLGHYRDRLILVDEQRRVAAVPAEDPTSDPVVLIDLEWSGWPWAVQAARMIDDHRLSLIVWSFAEPRDRAYVRLLIDLDSREAIGDTTDRWQADDLAWVPGGGLFEFDEGSYRYLAEGLPVAAGRRRLLVYECDGPQDCARHWIDRETGDRIDRPLPPDDPWQVEVLDADDRLLFVNGEDGHRYFDAENGWFLPANVIRGTAGGYLDHPAETVVGGRLLLAPIIDGMVIYDLDTHAARILDFGGERLRGVTAVVAVSKPNRWSEET